MTHYTRFRAYQLGEKGASFSISVDQYFILIEARYNSVNKPHVIYEMGLSGVAHIDVLHITSWDEDHCKSTELEDIIKELKPSIIECPGYAPHTITGLRSLSIILNSGCKVVRVTPSVVQSQFFTRLVGRDLFFGPINIKKGTTSNNMSVIKLFRIGSFQVLSLGDCEDSDIAKRLVEEEIITKEVDVLILAHHGADNGFTTTDFLKALNPRVAICACDWDNMYSHPSDKVRSMLSNLGIKYYSTKAGDIIAQSVDKYKFKVSNYITNNEKKDSVETFTNKTYYTQD